MNGLVVELRDEPEPNIFRIKKEPPFFIRKFIFWDALYRDYHQSHLDILR